MLVGSNKENPSSLSPSPSFSLFHSSFVGVRCGVGNLWGVHAGWLGINKLKQTRVHRMYLVGQAASVSSRCPRVTELMMMMPTRFLT